MVRPDCAHCTQAARRLRRVAGLAWPCRRLGPAVSQAWPGRVAGLARPCRRPGRSYRREHLRAPARSLRRVAVLPSALSRLYRDTTSGQASTPLSRYNRLYRGCRVTRHHSRKSGRVSFVRGALPKVQTCPNKFTMTTQGPYTSKNNGHLDPCINTHKISNQLLYLVQELTHYS